MSQEEEALCCWLTLCQPRDQCLQDLRELCFNGARRCKFKNKQSKLTGNGTIVGNTKFNRVTTVTIATDPAAQQTFLPDANDLLLLSVTEILNANLSQSRRNSNIQQSVCTVRSDLNHFILSPK